jgi:hypothetical protein
MCVFETYIFVNCDMKKCGPVGTSSDITSESGFFAGLVNAREAKKVSAM